MVVSHTLLIGNTELQNSKALWYARIMMDVTSIEENKEVTMVHWVNFKLLRGETLLIKNALKFYWPICLKNMLF